MITSDLTKGEAADSCETASFCCMLSSLVPVIFSEYSDILPSSKLELAI
jgi:hypothetical protein